MTDWIEAARPSSQVDIFGAGVVDDEDPGIYLEELEELEELTRYLDGRVTAGGVDTRMRWAEGEDERLGQVLFSRLELCGAIRIERGPNSKAKNVGAAAAFVYHFDCQRSETRTADARQHSVQQFIQGSSDGTAKTRFLRTLDLLDRLWDRLRLLTEIAVPDVEVGEIEPAPIPAQVWWCRSLEELSALMILLEAEKLLDFGCGLPTLVAAHFRDSRGRPLSAERIRESVADISKCLEAFRRAGNLVLETMESANRL